MMLVRTYVGPSSIEGLGVFAGEFIAGGSLVWMLDPKFDIVIEAGELDRVPPHMRDYIARYSYPHLERPGVLVLDADNGKFMNHSERPNTDFRVFDKGYALVDIAVGEEITCNYHEFDPSFTGCFVSPPRRSRPVRRSGNGNGKTLRA
jgi:SET domain-containing protein